MLRVSFSTNFCPHYRVRTFEILSKRHDFDFFFFSEGKEWYWQRKHGIRGGMFRHVYLPGFDVAGTRISLALPLKLWRGDYDVYIKCIDGRFALLSAFLVSRLRRKPFILWTGIWMRLNTPLHRMLFPLTRFIYRNADAVVAYGEHVKEFLISEGVTADRIFVAPHAVDNAVYGRHISEEERSRLREKLEIAPDKRIILSLGRLEEAKGLAYLLDAFCQLERGDVVLLFVGEGSYSSRLDSLARERGVRSQIRFVGHIPPDETPPYYALASVFVLPSITTATFREPWGLVVNEALNQGVPVVATDAVGAAAGGLVKDGYNGFIVKERDAQALARALRNLLDTPGLHAQMRQNALESIIRWDNERMVAGFCEAIEYVTEPKA